MTILICIMQMIIFTASASKKSKIKHYEYLNERALFIVLTAIVSIISCCILIFIILTCLHQRGYRFIRQENLNQNENSQQQQMMVMVPPHEKQQYKQFLYDVNQIMEVSRLSDNQC